MTTLERMLARQIEYFKFELDARGVDYAWVEEDYGDNPTTMAYILGGLCRD